MSAEFTWVRVIAYMTQCQQGLPGWGSLPTWLNVSRVYLGEGHCPHDSISTGFTWMKVTAHMTQCQQGLPGWGSLPTWLNVSRVYLGEGHCPSDSMSAGFTWVRVIAHMTQYQQGLPGWGSLPTWLNVNRVYLSEGHCPHDSMSAGFTWVRVIAYMTQCQQGLPGWGSLPTWLNVSRVYLGEGHRLRDPMSARSSEKCMLIIISAVLDITVLLCKAKTQYLLTRKVSRYCLLASHGRIVMHCCVSPRKHIDMMFIIYIRYRGFVFLLRTLTNQSMVLNSALILTAALSRRRTDLENRFKKVIN